MHIKSLQACTKLTGILLSGLLIAACGGNANKEIEDSNKQSENTSTQGNMINIGLAENVPTLDPAIASDTTSSRVLNDLFEGLVSEDENNNPVPGVAKSWQISKDGKTYTFHLREDAKWSNGEPVTAEDFVFSLKRAIDPKTASVMAVYLNAIGNAKDILAGNKSPDSLMVKALDNKTLVINLDHPQAFFLSVLVLSTASPVYPPAIKQYGDQWTQPQNMVSNGAYKLDKWVTNGVLSVTKNPYYWGNKEVKVNQVNFYPIPSPSDEYNQFRAGRLDMTYTMPQTASSAQYTKQFGEQFKNVTQLGAYFYWMNVKVPGLERLDVRKA